MRHPSWIRLLWTSEILKHEQKFLLLTKYRWIFSNWCLFPKSNYQMHFPICYPTPESFTVNFLKMDLELLNVSFWDFYDPRCTMMWQHILEICFLAVDIQGHCISIYNSVNQWFPILTTAMATKTVILLDHREGLLAKTDQTVTIDELSADKSKWTVIMEAAVEYTRILLDVCSSLHPVSV